ncbi:hypothetical protein AQ490_06725 [Wenjunlia vitaminophila]|uniref:Small secreted protein n=1 Tax=Wenjunlia vitaminophila TaxID=76728 RepID=A0A0T6LNA7_WENVI|nr:hypothetical protein AQ490_06725 [Wenjunlia vitaminophila]
MNEKVATALAGAALAALALAGCGGGDDNSKEMEAWAKDVCGSMKTLLDRAEQAEKDTGVVKEGEKPADLKKRLSQDMDTAATSYRELADDVNGAGPPPVDDGEQLHRDAVEQLRNSAKAYEDLKQQVDELDTKNQGNFAEGLTDVSKEQQALGKMDSEALRKLGTGETGRAMAEQPGCKASSSAPEASSDSGTASQDAAD